MATIATHNGSVVHREHNVRNPKVVSKENHINPNGRFEIWHDEKIRAAYERIFGEAQEKYNAKQQREERKIKSYYNNVAKDDKKHVAYEMIVGVYDKDVSDRVKEEILKEFVSDWKKRNPNLEMIGAYFHADEESETGVHVHVDYIPVAHGYTRGLEVQNGLNRALEEMGFKTISKTQTAQMAWERRENQYLEKLCKARGIAVERPTETKKEHEATDVFKARKKREDLEKDIIKLEKKNEALKAAKGPIGRIGPWKNEVDALKKENKGLKENVQQKEADIQRRNEMIYELSDKLERKKEQAPSLDTQIRAADRERIEDENNKLRQAIAVIRRTLKEHFPEASRVIEGMFGGQGHNRGR